MVVVDSQIGERYRRNNCDQGDDFRRQLLLDENAAAELGISNFCPRLRPAMSLLSRHKVGPLQQCVHLSDFQSSSTPLLPTDDLSSNTLSPCNDRFVLALPYFCEDISVASSHNMVRWSIIAQCDHPDKAPEVILLGLDDLSLILGYGDTTLRRPCGNQRPQNIQRRQHQTHQIIQERYWQQYVASDLFHIQCLTKWDLISKGTSNILLYCLLADQLYECYAQFQLYKLKVSLKSTPSMVQPLPQLIQAYTQYKQLIRLSTTTMGEIDTGTTDINVEIFVDLEGVINTKDYEDRRKQTMSPVLVRVRAIISMVSFEQTESHLQTFTGIPNQNEAKKVLHLASVTTTFPHISICENNSNKNAISSNAISSLNKRYFVRILNSKLEPTTHQGAMMAMMLDASTEPCLDTAMIDFVTYVRRVRHAAVQSYNCEIGSGEEHKHSSDNKIDNSIQLLLDSLYAIFCDSPSNGNYLLDYHINNNDESTYKNSSSFIRFLLVDSDVVTETTQLKYILTIEYNKKVYKEEKIKMNQGVDQITYKPIVPIVALRSVYDDENCEHNLNIGLCDMTESDSRHVKYDELAAIIKTATINGMRQLRHKVLQPILTRYNKQWSPSDPYFARSSQKPPPYPLP